MPYIIMKASRSPSQETAQVSDAYKGNVYDSWFSVVDGAIAETKMNPVGFKIWRVSDNKPLASTVESYWDGESVPKLETA